MEHRWISFFEAPPFENKPMTCMLKSDCSVCVKILHGYAIRKNSSLFFISESITSKQRLVPCIYRHLSLESSEYSVSSEKEYYLSDYDLKWLPFDCIKDEAFYNLSGRDLYLNVYIFTPQMHKPGEVTYENGPKYCLKTICNTPEEDLIKICDVLSLLE